jgi:hypothetical protein
MPAAPCRAGPRSRSRCRPAPSPLAHAHAERQQAEEAVGLAEVFGDEAEGAVADQEGARHLADAPRLARIEPQQHEQQHAFERELVQL